MDHTEQRKISEKSLANLKPFEKGQSGNPGGRPKNSLKNYVAAKLAEMSDEEKDDYLKDIVRR